MSESNGTHSDHIHRIFISAPNPTVDRTGLYVIVLLCLLLFILLFYLVYNFISYRRYCSMRKQNYLHQPSKGSLSNEQQSKKYFHCHEQQLILQTYRFPIRISTSLPVRSNSQRLDHLSSIKRSYPMINPLVSDL